MNGEVCEVTLWVTSLSCLGTPKKPLQEPGLKSFLQPWISSHEGGLYHFAAMTFSHMRKNKIKISLGSNEEEGGRMA